MSAEVTLWDAFSATINLRVAQPQPHLGLIQLNARREASSELISCDVRVTEFCKALTEVTGLVVLDPESAEDAARLAEALYLAGMVGAGNTDGECRTGVADRVQAALRELANPTPPKPDEPTGLGAVVEDKAGCLWIRSGASHADLNWRRCGEDAWHDYSIINAVRVLAEGVPE